MGYTQLHCTAAWDISFNNAPALHRSALLTYLPHNGLHYGRLPHYNGVRCGCVYPTLGCNWDVFAPCWGVVLSCLPRVGVQ